MKGKNKSESDPSGGLQSSNNVHKADSALDFIKYVCAVLALDQKVQHEVLVQTITFSQYDKSCMFCFFSEPIHHFPIATHPQLLQLTAFCVKDIFFYF